MFHSIPVGNSYISHCFKTPLVRIQIMFNKYTLVQYISRPGLVTHFIFNNIAVV